MSPTPGITASASSSAANPFLDFDWDDSETQAFTHIASAYQADQAHQRAWVTNRTRFGTGHAERFEVHNNSADLTGVSFSSPMVVADANDGGDTVGSVIGYPEVYWAWSSYLPTSGAGDADATLVSGFSQTQVPDYEHLFEIHERQNLSFLGEVANLAVMVDSNKLQWRQRCGTWTWNGSSYDAPAVNWSSGVVTNGSGIQPIPIVKASGTNSTMLMDAWIDIILHVRYRKDSTGLVEIWARQAGQSFTGSPQLSISGPTHKLTTGGPSDPRSSADYEAANGVTGCFLHCGVYTGSGTWSDTNNGAHVHIMDELRRYGTEAAAKANWG